MLVNTMCPKIIKKNVVYFCFLGFYMQLPLFATNMKFKEFLTNHICSVWINPEYIAVSLRLFSCYSVFIVNWQLMLNNLGMIIQPVLLFLQISAVRAVVPNKSNNEIVLVLQHFENSVDKAVQAFLEGMWMSVFNVKNCKL